MVSIMNHEEIAQFLGVGGTGVLALAGGEKPYAVPVSYGFDRSEPLLYLRLSEFSDSERAAHVEMPTACRFVVYDEIEGDWYSVIVEGSISHVDDEELTPRIADVLGRAELPIFDIVDHSSADVTYRVYRLTPTEISGHTTR